MSGLNQYGDGNVLVPGDWNALVYKLTAGSDSINTGSLVAQKAVLGSVFALTGSVGGSIVFNSFMVSNGSTTGSLLGNTFILNNGSVIGSLVSNKLIFSNGSFVGSLVGNVISLNNGSVTGSLVSNSVNIANSLVSASEYATGSYVISGTTNKILSPIGLGSPTVWTPRMEAGSVLISGQAGVLTTASHYLLDNDYVDAKNGNNGTARGAGNTFPAGKIISGLYCNNGYMDTAAAVGMPAGDGDVSVAYWASSSGVPAATAYMFYIGSIGQRRSFFLYEDTSSNVFLGNNDDTLVTCGGTTDSTFVHWTVTYSTTDKFYRVYKNATIVGSGQSVTGGSALNLTYPSAPFTIGARQAGNNKFLGTLDDVRVYSGLLGATQITSIYNLGNGTQTDSAGNIDGWAIFPTAFASVPSVTLGATGSLTGYSVIVGSLSVGSAYILGSVTGNYAEWVAVG